MQASAMKVHSVLRKKKKKRCGGFMATAFIFSSNIEVSGIEKDQGFMFSKNSSHNRKKCQLPAISRDHRKIFPLSSHNIGFLLFPNTQHNLQQLCRMLKDKPKVLSVETKTCLGKFEIRNSYVRSRNSVQDFKTKVFVDHFLRSVKKKPLITFTVQNEFVSRLFFRFGDRKWHWHLVVSI